VVPEVVITESTAMKSAVAAKFTATDSFGHPAATESAEAAAAKAASHAAMESAATKAAAMETAATKAAAMETAAAEATAVAAAAEAAAVATATAPATAATRQCHGWRSQANRRNCQQRDNRLTQHHHSPSESLAPNHNTSLHVAIVLENCYGLQRLHCSTLRERRRSI
jgi:hypothetical protein